MTRERRWPVEQASAWAARVGWLAGCNFTPSTASNQLELWQRETFDPDTIDRELGWAADLGFTAMRVFLHDLLWASDGDAFLDRIDQFLDISHAHGISIMPVLFDGVWDPEPALGPQADPVLGVHNSRWVQGPGAEILLDPTRWISVRPYVEAVISRFATDERIVVWDLFNEPAQRDRMHWKSEALARKSDAACAFTREIFAWARSVDPDQPLTVGLYGDFGDPDDPATQINEIAALESDVISFHSYDPIDKVAATIDDLAATGRPLLCTEWLARSEGSTIEILELFAARDVAAFNWGLVDGRTQTRWPWTSWRQPGTQSDPWFHELLRSDGSPYAEHESDFIRSAIAAKRSESR